MGSHWVDTEKLIFKKLKTIYSEEQSCTDSNLHIKNLEIMLKCVFKFSRSDWGLRIHVPNKFSGKTLVQKGKGVVGRAFTLELRSPGLQFDLVVPVSENLRDPTPSFSPYTTHSHNTIICLGPNATVLIMFFILFHVRTPLDSQAAFQLPQLNPG